VSSPLARPVPPLVQRLLTWTGVLPLGGFLLLHLGVNAVALRGTARFVRALGTLHGIRGLAVAEVCLIMVPLVVHAATGGWLVATRRSLAPARPYSPRLRLAMRVAGVGVLAFLALHLPEFRWRLAGERLEGSETASLLAADLSSTWQGMPWHGLAYLVGAGCAAFHFGLGLWALFASSSRGTASRRARVAAAWVFGAAGVSIWLGFADVVVLHATGAALFGGSYVAPAVDGSARCPAPPAP
jgi:succinate dehydrogenase cytochrome b subunit